MLDPYQTLGVGRTATQDEIKNAYRGLAKKYHPDLNPGKKEAEKKFKEINTAYEMIGTPESRQKYDRGETIGGFEEAARARRGPYYYETQEPGGGRYSWSEDIGADWINEIFGARMGGRRAGRAQEPPSQALYSMEIDLADSVKGAQKEFLLPDGKRYSVKIPPGVRTGTKLKIPGGLIELKVRPDPRFRIEGSNLIVEAPVPLADAILGGEITVPTIDGNARIKVPPHVNTGSKLKLAGKGLYDRTSGKRGDELVSLRVTLPSPPDPELDRIIRDWAKRSGDRKEAA